MMKVDYIPWLDKSNYTFYTVIKPVEIASPHGSDSKIFGIKYG